MPLSHRKKISLACAAVVFAIPVAAIAVLSHADWNRAKPWLNARVSEALGRPFAIEGDLSLTWVQPGGSAQPGWRGYLPWPHLQAENVRLGSPANLTPDGDTDTDAATVSQLAFSLNPLALFEKKIVIPQLRLDAPQLHLLRNKDGQNNWTFDQQSPSSPWRLELQSEIGRAHV